MGFVWAIIIGFIVGVIAKFLTGGSREPRGFILTTVLGILGGVVGTWLGQVVGLYGPNENGGFIAAVVGAIVLVLAWRALARTAR
ncbi:MAG TPA: GlsB/YeaQ/YmgE family stress response membrane protein [Devosiaceae bacterium]|jgi:uncharacterized membrane protein YeaQ/YmgE (transglycosylase-associated protein family)